MSALQSFATELAETDEVIIDDPLAFPWDSLPIPRGFAPITIRLADETLLDLAALEPIFRQLIRGDCIVARDDALTTYLRSRYRLSDSGAPLEQRTALKRRTRIELELVERIEADALNRGESISVNPSSPPEEPSSTTVIFVFDTLTAPLTEQIEQRCAAVGLNPMRVVDIWGVRERPGAQTQGAVVGVICDPASPIP